MITYSRIRLSHYFTNNNMIKTFCDACGKEIKKGDEVASINSIEKNYSFNRKTTTNVESIQVSRLACGDCFKKIKKIFEDAKKV